MQLLAIVSALADSPPTYEPEIIHEDDSTVLLIDHEAATAMRVYTADGDLDAVDFAEAMEDSTRAPDPTPAQLVERYPRAIEAASGMDGLASWDHVSKLKYPARGLAQAVVYKVLTSVGPDVDFARLAMVVDEIRLGCPRGNILAAFEVGTLLRYIQDQGLTGLGSDALRDPSDRFYP